MSRVIFASHGGLSKGMKDSVSMIVGDLAKDVETYSLLPGQNPVHTALSKLAVLDNVMVFSGMNMGLALDVVMKSLGQNLELADANDLIEAAKEGMTVMNGMTSEDDEDF